MKQVAVGMYKSEGLAEEITISIATKQNEAQNAHAEPTQKGVNQRPKDVTKHNNEDLSRLR